MDNYLKQYREMISLRGLTDHTIISYSTYIRAYLNYLSEILHKLPEDVSWAELRDFIRWLQKEKQLSDRTYLPTALFYHVCPAQTMGSYTASHAQV